MEKNRINLKELSEILNNEVENGNGDAYLFIGEYYLSNNKWEETYIEDNQMKSKKLDTTYSIYTDDVIKEKIMALSYLHVQKLTDEENLELIKLREGKSKPKEGKKSSGRLGDIFNTYAFAADIVEPQLPRGTIVGRYGAPARNAEAEQAQERLDALFDYITYLKETIAPHPGGDAIINRLETLENNLCLDNLTVTADQSNILANQIDTIIQQEAIRVRAANINRRRATELTNLVNDIVEEREPVAIVEERPAPDLDESMWVF